MTVHPRFTRRRAGRLHMALLAICALVALQACHRSLQVQPDAAPAGVSEMVVPTQADDPLLEDADRALQQGAFADAEFAYSTVLQSDPDHLHARLHRAVARLARGNRVGAAEDAEWALTSTAGTPAARELALEVLGRAGRCSIVVEQDHREVPDTLLATCLAQTGQLTAALQTVDRQPVPDADDLNTLGILLQSQGDHTGAESAWRDALAAEPGMLDALRNLGMLLFAAGREDEAIPLLQRYLVDVPPGTSDAPRIRGMLNRNDD
ncbi:MAG: tetratricopeptide repeat protein [Myxococcales bacterium]|nr:tetratricopeptide repeat protein [Myxococcales bacterium]